MLILSVCVLGYLKKQGIAVCISAKFSYRNYITSVWLVF